MVQRIISKTAAHILVADDDRVVRLLCRAALEAEGFTVEEAEDGQKALDLIIDKDFDLLLTDMEMPNLDGMSLLAKGAAMVKPDVPKKTPAILPSVEPPAAAARA